MSSSYQKFAGVCGMLTGAAGLLYLVLFVVLRNPAALLPALALLCVGIFSSVVLVAVYHLIRGVDESFALWGLFLGLGGAGGAAIHAAFDLSNNLHPPAALFGFANPVDPRGFLTFAVTGLAVALFSWLIVLRGVLPRLVGYLGLFTGLLLILLYIAYLTILNATHPIVFLLVLLSGILQPIWYLWIGWWLLQGIASGPAKKT